MRLVPEIMTAEPARELLAAHFPRRGRLPTQGGRGYTRERACIIEKDVNDPGFGIPSR